MNTALTDEKQLIKDAMNGDGDAFGQLVTKYEKKIYSFALGMLSNPDDAFDVSQETFLKAYRSLKFFKGESSFYTWLYTICRNCCYDFIKQQSRQRKKNVSLYEYESDPDGTVIEIPDNANDPEKLFEQKQVRTIIYDAIMSLPDNHREIILLRDIQGLSYEEIAVAMYINEGTVKSRLSRARSKLQLILKEKL
ncbi:MAG: sigma-70 family RNA polymerase sigma factor [Ruminococcaceae bacterium]|nr:sigma-70 family RNA polymerase sigma factor [Oscillospiraceae bacterium]